MNNKAAGESNAVKNCPDKILIRYEEFAYIVQHLMRLSMTEMSPSVNGARMVLFEGKTQTQAAEILGISKGNICTTLTRIRTHHEKLTEAYRTRFTVQPIRQEPAPQSERIISILKRFQALGVNDIDAMLQILETSGELDLEKLLNTMELTRSLAS